jgi:hypothetical protein
MKNEIRKISIGVDYKNSMHYIVSQEVLSGYYNIHAIIRNEQNMSYLIYIESKEKEIVLWKEINTNLPIVVEFNINY